MEFRYSNLSGIAVGCLFASSIALTVPQCTSRQAETELTILYTGRGNGALAGCDCPEGPPGGLPRRATVFDSVRRARPHVLAVDAGDFLNTYSDPARNAAILAVLPRLGYAALNVGDQEFVEGLGWFISRAGELPLVAANLRNTTTRRPIAPARRVMHINSICINIIGIISRDAFALAPAESVAELDVAAPESSLTAAIGRVRKNTGLVIVLSQLGWERDTLLARRVPGIDLVVGGHWGPVVRAPYRVGRTLIVESGERGEEVGVLTLTLDRTGKIIAWNADHLALGRGVAEDTTLVRLIEDQRFSVNGFSRSKSGKNTW